MLEEFDRRFSYILSDWKQGELEDPDYGEDEDGSPYYYVIYCSGFWEGKFVHKIPGIVTPKDIKEDKGTLMKDVMENLVNSTYDVVLEKLGYEPYGPLPLHHR
jgi:hypothetical protein